MTVLSVRNRALTQVATRRRILVQPASQLPRMTRYRGGTYSHTVDKIVFVDGSSARTDLIRLNPNLDAYSLDYTGIAPHHPSRYRVDGWSALPHLNARDCEVEVDWILRNSFPVSSIADLSRQLRQAGYPLGAANISDHEAIAATQAAIWYFTNDMALDTQPLNVPVSAKRGPGATITFEFDGEPQLGGYSLRMASDTAVGLKLQKSTDGVVWQDISGSQLTADAGEGRRYQRTLGVGSTLSGSSHGRRRTGLSLLPVGHDNRRDDPEDRPCSLLANRYPALPQCRSRRASLQLPTYRCTQGPARYLEQARFSTSGRCAGNRRIRTRRTIPSANPIDTQRH